VYRHFPDRAELFASVCRKVESMRPAIPEVASFDRPTFEEQIRKHWARFDDPSSLEHKATRLSAVFELSRVGSVPRRRAVIEKLVNDAAPRLREPHRTYVIELLAVIASSATVEALRGYLGRRTARSFAPPHMGTLAASATAGRGARSAFAGSGATVDATRPAAARRSAPPGGGRCA
jgi:AcrR family transcriptional regulator